MGKEQELVMMERAKWMAQNQEEERIQARQKMAQDLQKSAACQSDAASASCSQSQPASAPQPENSGGQEHQINLPPSGFAPPDQNIPNFPISPDVLQRAQLMQTGTGSSGSSSQISPFSQPGFLSASSSTSLDSGGRSTDSGDTGPNRQLIAAFGGARPGMGRSTDGLLSSFGTGMGMGTGAGASGGFPGLGGPIGGLSLGPGALPCVDVQPSPRSP